ncbi:EAL domain-containing protein [Aquipuribacter sp. MA13-6]|uniref:EAL domain-containing protein n=1 Tax=unclassified Aquipuribacter TaxID=2635084 RepID=UPI003EEEE645
MITNERRRQESVRRYGLPLDPPPARPDPELTALVVQAQRLMRAEFAAVHVLDGEGQVRIAGTPGLPLEVVERSSSMCNRVAAAYPGRQSYLTTAADVDPFFADNAWVDGRLGAVRYYAAVPLVGLEGLPLGVLCAWSSNEAPSPAPSVELIAKVGTAVVALLDSRRRTAEVPGPVGGADAAVVGTLADRSVHGVIDTGAVTTLFQPVVHLATGSVAGFEALSRGPSGTDLEAPMALIEAAAAAGRLADLDWLCRVNAMAAAAQADLHPGLSWFINVEPVSLHHECPPHLVNALAHARSELRIILEVVERDLNGHVTHLLHAADQARRDVWGVALDDVGPNESSLALLPLLMPDVVKLDMSLVHQLPDRRTAIVTAAVRAYAERTGAVILAEGIETEEHEHLARVFGATYVQGYRYGRPGPLPDSVPAPRAVVPLRQQPAPLDGATPFEVASASAPVERARRGLLEHMVEHLEARCRVLPDPFVLLVGLQSGHGDQPERLTSLQELSGLSALTVVLAEGAEVESTERFAVTERQVGSRMRQEWFVAVLSAGYSAAFVARDCGDPGDDDADRRYDFVLIHDPGLVTAVGRSFLQELVPVGSLPSMGGQIPGPRGTPVEDPAPSRGGSLLKRYTRAR